MPPVTMQPQGILTIRFPATMLFDLLKANVVPGEESL